MDRETVDEISQQQQQLASDSSSQEVSMIYSDKLSISFISQSQGGIM